MSEAIETTETEDVVVDEAKSTINLDKFDKPKEAENGLSEVEKLKKELDEERKARAKAEDERQRFKDSFDKKASEVAKKNRELRETSKLAEQPLEELEAYKQQVAEFQLREKKTDLLYSLTEELGISKEMSETMVGAIYHEETNELSIADLVTSFRTIVDEVRTASYEKGYNTRDEEKIGSKPRSLANQKGETAAERKRREYLENNARR